MRPAGKSDSVNWVFILPSPPARRGYASATKYCVHSIESSARPRNFSSSHRSRRSPVCPPNSASSGIYMPDLNRSRIMNPARSICPVVNLAHQINHSRDEGDLAAKFEQTVTLRRRQDQDAAGFEQTMDPGQGRRGVGYMLDHLAAQHHGEALLAQVRVRDVVGDEAQVRVPRREASRMVKMRIVEVGCHHFAVKFREHGQVDARAEADLERTTRTMPRAGAEC